MRPSAKEHCPIKTNHCLFLCLLHKRIGRNVDEGYRLCAGSRFINEYLIMWKVTHLACIKRAVKPRLKKSFTAAQRKKDCSLNPRKIKKKKKKGDRNKKKKLQRQMRGGVITQRMNKRQRRNTKDETALRLSIIKRKRNLSACVWRALFHSEMFKD